jgi:UDP-glucuronate 4-epimerase
MRILVTGGAGFIGSHLSERLLREGHSLAIVDDLNDFYSPAEKQENLAAIRRSGEVQFRQADISDVGTILEIVSATQPDAIIHLAARAGVRPSLEQPILYERVNVLGTLALLEAARKVGVRKFVFASSSSIYGIANRVPFSEDDYVNMPVSPYAATKIAGEKFAYAYSHLYGLNTICLRFFTVFGPRQRPDLAIRKFTERIGRGESIPVFGDGTSARDYTFVEDIVQGIVAALLYNCQYEVFNLGNSSPVALLRMIRTIAEALGHEAKIMWLPDQPGDVPVTYADIGKARRLLGYCPKTTFENGIGRFVEWYRSRQTGSPTSAVE